MEDGHQDAAERGAALQGSGEAQDGFTTAGVGLRQLGHGRGAAKDGVQQGECAMHRRRADAQAGPALCRGANTGGLHVQDVLSLPRTRACSLITSTVTSTARSSWATTQKVAQTFQVVSGVVAHPADAALVVLIGAARPDAARVRVAVESRRYFGPSNEQ